MLPQARHTCLHFRHTSRVEPQTSHVSAGGASGFSASPIQTCTGVAGAGVPPSSSSTASTTW